MRWYRLFFALIFALYAFADINLTGYMHLGDNDKPQYLLHDPLTLKGKSTYQYYLDYPTKFYLANDANITGIELLGADEIESNDAIKVYIDGNLVATGTPGGSIIYFNKELQAGWHTVAVEGMCKSEDLLGNCTNIDDFYFSGYRLISSADNGAYNFIQRRHIGDNTDNNDDYDMSRFYRRNYYPDASEATAIEYNFSMACEGYVEFYFSRLRDIDGNGINKLEFYIGNSLQTVFDLNASDIGIYDKDYIYSTPVGPFNNGKVVIRDGKFNDGTYDDISWDEFIIIPNCLDAPLPKPVVEYRMDECSWDSDTNTLEVKNSGSGGDDYNATARNGANTEKDADGGICRAGNFISSATEDKALTFQNNFPLTSTYTLTVWIKFPLTQDGHKVFNRRYEYYNIADRKGSSSDYLYFRHNVRNDTWELTVADDSTYSRLDFNPQNLSGWHFLAFVVSQNKTDFYFDGEYKYTFDAYPTTGEIAVLFNSDYQYSVSGEPNQQSIGSLADEFKIFDKALSRGEIYRIYQNEKNGKNYDGSVRACQNCLSKLLIAQWRMDECSWDSDPNTYEVLNDIDNNYNATALYGAKPIPAKVCNGGNIDSAVDGNIALRINNGYALPQSYTFNCWIRFPLETANHKIFTSGFSNVEYYNIADRVGSSNDFIYFEYIENVGWYLVLDGNSNSSDAVAFNPQNLTGWHMLTFVVKNGSTDFYLDGNLNYTFSVSPNGGSLGLLFNSDYGANDNEPNGQAIGAVVDEVKIFQGNLSQSEIGSLLSESRVCPNCNRNYKFDCWDSFRNEQDRNISTKIVQDAIQLNLAEVDENGTYRNEFNGTVCAVVFDENTLQPISDWNATVWSNSKPDEDNNRTIEFNVAKAVKRARVYIYWMENLQTDKSSCNGLFNHDQNETNSTDNFAIRPLKYEISIPSTTLVAGTSFDINFSAKDAAGNFTKEYNESVNSTFQVDMAYFKPNCIRGSFIPDINESWQFQDGNSSLNVVYDEVNELNITIQEKQECQNRFASVDCKDGNVTGYWNSSDTAIEPYTTPKIRFIPHHFGIDAFLRNFDQNFTYLSTDLNMSAILELNITAQNEQNQTTQNYNKECFAKDIDINITHSFVTSTNLANLYFIYQDDLDNNSTLIKIDKNSLLVIQGYTSDNFTTDHNGTTNMKIFINFDRNSSKPVDPFDFNITDINVSDTQSVRGYKNAIDSTVNFYYGRIVVNDLSTSEPDDNTTANILIYDTDIGDGVGATSEDNQTILNWYVNSAHDKASMGAVGEANVTRSVVLDNTVSTITADPGAPKNGMIAITIHNPNAQEGVYYIHLDIPSWLWFSYTGIEYDYSNGSDCTQHPCIKYNFYAPNQNSGVQSGIVNGTDFDQNVTSNKRGVKVFR